MNEPWWLRAEANSFLHLEEKHCISQYLLRDHRQYGQLSLSEFFQTYSIRSYLRDQATQNIIGLQVSRNQQPTILRVFPLTTLNEEAQLNAECNSTFYRLQTLLHVPFDLETRIDLCRPNESWEQAFMRHLNAGRVSRTEWFDGRSAQIWQQHLLEYEQNQMLLNNLNLEEIFNRPMQ